jgi:hypothetical protein
MSPHEVAGLNYLAKKQGTKLTVNPHTGLPEAFSLGGFFKGLLPVFAGAMTGGASMPLWAGIAAGAATGAVTNKDHLMGALTGGLGGYSGFGLGKGLFAAGAPSAIPGAAGSVGVIGPTGEMGSNLLTASRGIAPGAGSAMANAAGNAYDLTNTAVNTSGLSAGNVNPALANLQNTANTSGFTASAGTGASGVDKSFLGGMDRLGPGAQQMGTGIKNIYNSQPGAWDAFKGSFAEEGAKPISDIAAYGKIGMPVGGAVLSGLEPSDIYGEPIDMSAAKEKEKYDPYSRLNLSGDTGLRLVAEGGYIDGYAMGGPVGNPSSGAGISDLYNRPEGQTNEYISNDGYGIGRLNTLANAESINNAKTLGYAMGGPVSFADGGSTDPLTGEIQPIDQAAGITSLTPQPTTSQTMPTQQVQNAALNLDNQNNQGSIISQVTTNLKTDPNYQGKNPIEAAIVKQLKGSDPMQQGQPNQQAQGLGSIAPSQPMAPSFNPSTAMTPTYYAGMNTPQGYAEGGDVSNYRQDQASLNLDRLPSLNVNTGVNSSPNAPIDENTFKSIMYRMSPLGSNGPSGKSIYDQFNTDARNKGFLLDTMRVQGRAKGGYLDGAGDGMSDSIPATIEGKQPARLADGEFVVPADVVSHIGNGSSKAGSQRLYSMLDKVRKARTGNKKQGKQINPSKYMPA